MNPYSVTPTRRQFLVGLATTAAVGLDARGSRAAALTGAIDVHHHVFPPEFLAVARANSVSPAIIEQWTLARTLEEMERNGVRTAVVSITQPGVWYGQVEQA